MKIRNIMSNYNQYPQALVKPEVYFSNSGHPDSVKL